MVWYGVVWCGDCVTVAVHTGSPAVMQMASGSFDLQSNLDLLPGLASLDSGGGLPLQLSAGGGMDEGD